MGWTMRGCSCRKAKSSAAWMWSLWSEDCHSLVAAAVCWAASAEHHHIGPADASTSRPSASQCKFLQGRTGLCIALQAAVQAVHNCARVGFRQSQLVRKAREREQRRRLQEEQHRRLEQQLDAIRAEVRHELPTGARDTAEGCTCCMVQTEDPPYLARLCVNKQARLNCCAFLQIRTGC